MFDGAAIYNAFRQHKSKIVTHIDGLAASYASVIAMAGDEVRISKNAFLMIHNPWSIAIGDADDMRATADLLDKMQGTIAEMYADKTGKEIDEIKEIMTAETWYTAQEALEAGFVDKIEDLDEKTEAKAKILFDLSVFNNVPNALLENRQSPTEKEMERALRDVGCSIKQAKAILADGYQKEAPRDVETSIETPQASVETPRDVGKPAPRDVEQPKQVKDRARALLIKAEQVAPHKA